jgi:hypothetical protein
MLGGVRRNGDVERLNYKLAYTGHCDNYYYLPVNVRRLLRAYLAGWAAA